MLTQHFLLPVTVIDHSGHARSVVEPAPRDRPAELSRSDPSAARSIVDPKRLVISWVGGLCDSQVYLIVGPAADTISIVTQVAPGACDAMGLQRVAAIDFDAPVGDELRVTSTFASGRLSVTFPADTTVNVIDATDALVAAEATLLADPMGVEWEPSVFPGPGPDQLVVTWMGGVCADHTDLVVGPDPHQVAVTEVPKTLADPSATSAPCIAVAAIRALLLTFAHDVEPAATPTPTEIAGRRLRRTTSRLRCDGRRVVCPPGL